MRIRERLEAGLADVLWNEITIEDPVVLEKPHPTRSPYRRMPNYTLLEYVLRGQSRVRRRSGPAADQGRCPVADHDGTL
jgi:hypothetical protein